MDRNGHTSPIMRQITTDKLELESWLNGGKVHHGQKWPQKSNHEADCDRQTSIRITFERRKSSNCPIMRQIVTVKASSNGEKVQHGKNG